MNQSLKRIANRLERLGMVTAPFADHLSVRLPLLCHIRVWVADGRLRCEPHTGAVSRTRATLLVFLVFGTLLSTTFARHGLDADTVTMGFFTVLAFALETLRYIVTESCITRIQAAVLAEPGLLDDAVALSSGTAPAALGAGDRAAAEPVRQPERERAR